MPLLLLLLVAGLLYPVTGCSSFNPAYPLVMAPLQRATMGESDAVFTRLFSAGKPVVIYVHGRGDEPEKSGKQKILESLERDYDVKVLMVNWDSHALLLNRPVQRAQAGASALRETIARLIDYRSGHPETRNIPVSLLVHSMGNIVLREALDQGLAMSADGIPLFTNVLITGSDEDDEGHDSWVKKITVKGSIVITVNANDVALRLSRHDEGKTPLGAGIKGRVAENCWYLDVTGIVGNEHRLFAKERLHDAPGVCTIFTFLLRSEMPEFPVGKTIARVERERILIPVQ